MKRDDMMEWWKRLILTVVSLIWGFVSLDYLYMAFCFLTGRRTWTGRNFLVGDVSLQDIPWELFGLLMFLVWFLILACYIWLIRRLSPQVDMTELNMEGKEHVRRKWADVFWQMVLVVTGALVRWGYLCMVFFPGQ